MLNTKINFMKTRVLWLAVLAFIFYASCSKEEKATMPSGQENSPLSFDEQKYAVQTALDFLNVRSGTGTKGSNNTEVLDVNLRHYQISYLDSATWETKTTRVPVYFITFSKAGKTGLSIVSGDLRIPGVFASIEEGTLADSLTNYGLYSTLNAIPDMCSASLASFYAQRSKGINDFKLATRSNTGNVKIIKSIEDGWAIIREYIEKDQVSVVYPQKLKTKWNQHNPYNKLLDKIDGKYPPTGCVAVAGAQICALYELPAEYDWELLTSSPTVTIRDPIERQNEVAALMRRIGEDADMEYALSESITTLTKLLSALRSYGIKTEPFIAEYDANLASMLMQANRIVMRGQGKEKKTKQLDGGEIVGHAWVVDGGRVVTTENEVREYKKYMGHALVGDDPSQLPNSFWENLLNDPSSEGGTYTTSQNNYYLWCNWGWGGSYDGEYGIRAFNPGGSGYNQENKMFWISDKYIPE